MKTHSIPIIEFTTGRMPTTRNDPPQISFGWETINVVTDDLDRQWRELILRLKINRRVFCLQLRITRVTPSDFGNASALTAPAPDYGSYPLGDDRR